MKSKDKKSIFDINSKFLQNIDTLLTAGTQGFLDNIELVSKNTPAEHALSKNIEFDNIYARKNDMVELVKRGFKLPEADEPERMLASSEEKIEAKEQNTREENAFKMADLISKSYNLPDISKKDISG